MFHAFMFHEDLPKIESLGGVQNVLLQRGEKHEKRRNGGGGWGGRG